MFETRKFGEEMVWPTWIFIGLDVGLVGGRKGFGRIMESVQEIC